MQCSPSASTIAACLFALKFCSVSRNSAVQKDVWVFVFICGSLFLKNKFDWKQPIFMKKHKNHIHQNQWSITKMWTPFCSYGYLLRVNMKKKRKNVPCGCRRSKRWKTAGFGNTLPQYLPNPKIKFSLKFIFT